MSFWGELRRRNVVKMAAAYAIIAWLSIQVADTLLPIFGAPDWVLPVIVMLLAMGFVLVVFFSWAYELTPQGLVRTEEVPLSESVTRATGRKINVAIIALLVLALGFLAFDQYVLEEREGEALAATVAPEPEPGPISAPASGGRDRLPNSVAVLPFGNLSPDQDDAYFAEGLHEEILNQLVKLSDLSVISRTTMLQYAGQDKTPPQIADELNVETVMEGSVRYAGQRIRVTIQLIDPETDLHLVSETYNADISNLDEIFSIQSDIAMRVANALQAEFSPSEQARIEQIPTDSPEAFSEFLAAKAYNSGYTRDGFLRAIERIDEALRLDPDFGLAWAAKSRIHANAVPFFPEDAAEHTALAIDAMQRALETGPDIPEVHVEAAMVLTVTGEWQRVEAEIARAVELGMSPSEASQYMLFRAGLGLVDEQAEQWRDAYERDPLNPAVSFWVTAVLDMAGDTAGALAEYERGRRLFGDDWVGHFNAFVTLLGSGEPERARTLAQTVRPSTIVADVLDDFDRPEDALMTLRALYEGDAHRDLGGWQAIGVLAAYFGDEELAMSAMRDALNAFGVSAYLWRPVFAELRRSEGFKRLARDFGFVDYWREYGWPDSCAPVGANDFECR